MFPSIAGVHGPGRLVRALISTSLSVFSVGASMSLAAEVEGPPLDQGLDLRARAAVTPSMARFSYRGPPIDMSGDPDEPPASESELHFSTTAAAVGGELTLGVGYYDGFANRFGLDGSVQLAGTFAGRTGIPHTVISSFLLATLGPSYSRTLSPVWQLDTSLRGAMLLQGGSRNDIGSPDNVYELMRLRGVLASLTGICRLRPGGHTALTLGLSGGPLFAGVERALYVGSSVGIQID